LRWPRQAFGPPPALEIAKPIEFEVRSGATASLRVVLDTRIR
jgi:hypothetical protein